MNKNLPQRNSRTIRASQKTHSIDEMIALFDSDDEEGDFLGFNVSNSNTKYHNEVITLLESDDDEDDFLGFDASDSSIKYLNENNRREMRVLFESDSESTFLGFDSFEIETHSSSQSDVEDADVLTS